MTFSSFYFEQNVNQSEIYDEILNLIPECKNNMRNFYSNLFGSIDKKLTSFISTLDINSDDPFSKSINNLQSGIRENVKIAPSEEKINDILSKLENIRQYKINITSEFGAQLKGDYQSVISSKAQNIEQQLQSLYNEIESESNELLLLMNNDSYKPDYYEQIKLGISKSFKFY